MVPMDAEEFRKAGYQAIDQSILSFYSGYNKSSRRVLSDHFGEDGVAFGRTRLYEEIVAQCNPQRGCEMGRNPTRHRKDHHGSIYLKCLAKGQ